MGYTPLDKSIKNRYKNLVIKSQKRGIDPPKQAEIARMIRLHYGNGFDCYYCSKPLIIKNGATPSHDTYTLDHKIPLSKFGTNDISNLCISCHQCNYVKADYTEEAFAKWFKIVRLNEVTIIQNVSTGVVYTEQNYHDAY